MSKELVNYEEKMAAMAVAAVAIERPTGASIGTRAGILTYGGKPVPNNKLDVIVVASTHFNSYYEGKYDPDNIQPPVCYAYSPDGVEMGPHPAAAKPQHTDCATCPKNHWGSGTRDGKPSKGKACKNSRVLGIIPASTQADAMADAEVATLSLPVMSVGNWSTYVNKVAALANRPPLGVVTTIGTVPDMQSQFKITFQMGDLVDVIRLGGVFAKAEQAAPMLVREYSAPSEAAPAKNKKF